MPVASRGRAVLAAAVTTLGITVAGVAVAANVQPARGAAKGALSATLKGADGRTVGTAKLTPGRNGRYEVRIALSGLTPGFHGVHIHQTGVCEADAKDPAGAAAPFSTAGPHLKSDPAQTHGAHAADLPPALVMRNGTAMARVVTDRLTAKDILDADGSAFMVHVGADNSANIPPRYHAHTPDASSTTFGPDAVTLATGDAGGRAACGVLRRSGR